MFEPLSTALILSTANPNVPNCWMVQPGPPLTTEGFVGWYLEGEHKLDVPVSWDVYRTYEELVSYGFCKTEAVIISPLAQEIFNMAEEIISPPPIQPLNVTDWVLKRAIGRAEGTRDGDGNPNQAWYGHTDPGWQGKCQNLGSFSYQHCANNPEEADQKWLKNELRPKAEPHIQNMAKEKFGAPLSSAALVVGLDAWTQSPDAGRRYVKFLPSHDPTPDQLINARTDALNESRDKIGGPEWFKVAPDQRRRVNAILGQLEILHREQIEEAKQQQQ